jgi:alanine dehydrogenase
MPAIVSRTASYGLNNASIGYIMNIANNGLLSAVNTEEGLSKGVCTHNGYCCNESVAEIFGLKLRPFRVFPTN